MKTISSDRAFQAALATLALGEVDQFGASDHAEIEKKLRAYNARTARKEQVSRFAERSVLINAAADKGYAERIVNRDLAIRALSRAS